VREKIRAKSWYQLFEVIQFFEFLNRFVRGQFSLGQTLQVIALGQIHTSPRRDQCMMPRDAWMDDDELAVRCIHGKTNHLTKKQNRDETTKSDAIP